MTREEEETGAVDRNRVISTSDWKTDENVDLAWRLRGEGQSGSM